MTTPCLNGCWLLAAGCWLLKVTNQSVRAEETRCNEQRAALLEKCCGCVTP
ncbi:hypothetical protein AB0L75_30015 [Streptomyces sp. NPDC052101]|uniref:hypothetical protein n=1 Tax=Streptomyces sp. NPDC052101 TaxID=3155763 RepID=UPI003444F07D